MHTVAQNEDTDPAQRSCQPMKLSILGATGSIGTSALELVDFAQPEAFEIVALTAHSQVAALATQAVRHRAKIAVIGDDRHYGELKSALAGTGIEVASGASGLEDAADRESDCVLSAIVGAAGLRPTLRAAKRSHRLALANKESLVVAGDLLLSTIEDADTELVPVDSEHSAVFQALSLEGSGARTGELERIVLTASGGPFRTTPLDALRDATRGAALAHPNWSMGDKITIDSATLMNKGLELIEAYHLFPVEIEQLDAIVHPQSIVHCLVHYCDGSVIAQMAMPDMRTPIAYSLSWPQRMSTPTPRLDLAAIGSLTFSAVDHERFPAVRICLAALGEGGCATTVLNAANEVAVDAFLREQIGFLDIAAIVEETLNAAIGVGLAQQRSALEDILKVDAEARLLAGDLVSRRGVSRERVVSSP